MKVRSVFTALLFGATLAAAGGARDTLTITKVEDIHIVDPLAATKGTVEPNNGNSKLIEIAGFKC